MLGGNASGKSTTLKTILGIVSPRNGTVRFGGEDVTGKVTAHRIARGLAIVPENRRVFAPMTVLENLEMGAYLSPEGCDLKEEFERVYTLPCCCTTAASSSPGRCPAASSRCSRWAAR